MVAIVVIKGHATSHRRLFLSSTLVALLPYR